MNTFWGRKKSADGSGACTALAKWTCGLARGASIVANQKSPFIWAELDFLKSHGAGVVIVCHAKANALDKCAAASRVREHAVKVRHHFEITKTS